MTSGPAPGPKQPAGAAAVQPRTPECERRDSPPEIELLTALARGRIFLRRYRSTGSTVDGEIFHLDAAYPRVSHRHRVSGLRRAPDRTRFDADHRRFRLLTLAGWSVLYFTSATTAGELVEHITRLRSSSRQA